jgi:hypothetical protein
VGAGEIAGEQAGGKLTMLSKTVLVRDFYRPDGAYAVDIDEQGTGSSFRIVQGDVKLQGFGVMCEHLGRQTLAAYFLERINVKENRPDFSSRMFLAMNGLVFCVDDSSCKVFWHRGWLTRTLLMQDPRIGTVEHVYHWPLHRQLWSRLFGDPFNFVSNDYFEEMFKMVNFYHPESIDRV